MERRYSTPLSPRTIPNNRTLHPSPPPMNVPALLAPLGPPAPSAQRHFDMERHLAAFARNHTQREVEALRAHLLQNRDALEECYRRVNEKLDLAQRLMAEIYNLRDLVPSGPRARDMQIAVQEAKDIAESYKKRGILLQTIPPFDAAHPLDFGNSINNGLKSLNSSQLIAGGDSKAMEVERGKGWDDRYADARDERFGSEDILRRRSSGAPGYGYGLKDGYGQQRDRMGRP